MQSLSQSLRFLSLSSFALSMAAPVAASIEHPNVIFLFADDIRAESVFEISGNEVKTPNIDRLAQQGMRFNNAYTMGSLTAPVCMASRAMVMSGRGIFEQELRGWWIPEEMTMLPEAFRNAGYRTFFSGKWHNDRDSLYRSFEHGGTVIGNPKPHQYEFPATNFDTREDFMHQGAHTTDLLINEAIENLDVPEDERPFFMYLSFSAAHWPWEAPWRWMARYNPDEIYLPNSFRGRHPFDNGELGQNGTTTETKYVGIPRDPAEVRAIIARYYSMISHLDDSIGRLMEALQETSLLENTIIVFSADNGLALGSHGLFSKQNIYESGVRVPLVFYGPGVPADRQSDALTYLHDVYPTLCDLAGVAVPESVTGNSQEPVVTGSTSEIRDSLMVVYKHFMRGYRRGPWKLHKYNVKGEQVSLLYDVVSDPWENVNLAGKPEMQSVLESLTMKLQAEMKAAGDPVILNEPDWGVEQIPEHPFSRDYWRAREQALYGE